MRLTAAALAGCAVLLAACGTTDDGGLRYAVHRVSSGLAAIQRDRGVSTDVSVETRPSGGDARTLSCLAVEADPRRPDGSHLTMTNWGSDAVLGPDGECQGSPEAHQVVLLGDTALVEDGPPPSGTTACLSTFRRHRLSPDVARQLRQATTTRRPTLQDVLAAATNASGTDTVTMTIDPRNVPATSKDVERETMTVRFAGPRSTRVEAVEVRLDSGDDEVVSHYRFTHETAQQYSEIPTVCVARGTGPALGVADVEAALGSESEVQVRAHDDRPVDGQAEVQRRIGGVVR